MSKMMTRKQVNRMWAEFQLDQSPNRIAKKVKVRHETVKRYIENGDPKRNIEPFKVRFARIQAKADEKVADHQADDLKSVRMLIRAGIAKMFTTKMDPKTKKDTLTLEDAPSMGDLEKLMRLSAFLSGGPDARVEHALRGEVQKVVGAVTKAVRLVVKDPKKCEEIANALDSILAGQLDQQELAASTAVN